VKKALSAAATAFVVCLAACGNGNAASNPLMGKWKLASGSCPIDGMSFSPKTYTEHIVAIGPYPAKEDTHAASYDWEAPNKAIVTGLGTGAGSEIMIMKDQDHMVPTDNDECTYVRVK
jgi:hypothetical protein